MHGPRYTRQLSSQNGLSQQPVAACGCSSDPFSVDRVQVVKIYPVEP
jgi:hypothetical protein